MAGASSSHPFDGTICTPAVGVEDANTPIKEFFRLPLKEHNEIEVCIKATKEANIVLYDADKAANPDDIQVQVVIGGGVNGSTVSIGLNKTLDGGTHPSASVEKVGVLSATHFKTFVIRWYYGRLNIYSDGSKKSFLSWDGPKSLLIGNIGVRTVGCSGNWIVQGAPILNTADSKEYNNIEMNCGRLDFEVKVYRDAYIMFTPAPKADRAPSYHVIIGCGDAIRCNVIWFNFGQVAITNDSNALPPPLSTNEFHKFWIKWDSCTIKMGKGGNEDPNVQWLNQATPFKPIRYFGLQTHFYSGRAYWRILSNVTDDDVPPPPPPPPLLPPPVLQQFGTSTTGQTGGNGTNNQGQQQPGGGQQLVGQGGSGQTGSGGLGPQSGSSSSEASKNAATTGGQTGGGSNGPPGSGDGGQSSSGSTGQTGTGGGGQSSSGTTGQTGAGGGGQSSSGTTGQSGSSGHNVTVDKSGRLVHSGGDSTTSATTPSWQDLQKGLWKPAGNTTGNSGTTVDKSGRIVSSSSGGTPTWQQIHLGLHRK